MTMRTLALGAMLWTTAAVAGETLACNLKALTEAERKRHQGLTGQLRAAVVEQRELREGYAFRLSPQGMTLPELAEWLSLERKCCSFIDFRVEVPRAGGPVWLRVGGPKGVKDVLRRAFRQ